jgi:acyl carrier protein
MIDKAKLIEVLKKAELDILVNFNDFDKSFKDIGLDSLDVFNFFTEIEINLNKKIEDQDYKKINTLNELLLFLNKDD